MGWVYADPDLSGRRADRSFFGRAPNEALSEHHTVNCSISDMELGVSRPGRQPLSLTVQGGAAYELGMREHDHGMAIEPYSDG